MPRANLLYFLIPPDMPCVNFLYFLKPSAPPLSALVAEKLLLEVQRQRMERGVEEKVGTQTFLISL
jgi:hypothetical protein